MRHFIIALGLLGICGCGLEQNDEFYLLDQDGKAETIYRQDLEIDVPLTVNSLESQHHLLVTRMPEYGSFSLSISGKGSFHSAWQRVKELSEVQLNNLKTVAEANFNSNSTGKLDRLFIGTYNTNEPGYIVVYTRDVSGFSPTKGVDTTVEINQLKDLKDHMIR